MAAQSFADAHAQLYGQQPTNQGTSSFAEAHQQLITANMQKSKPTVSAPVKATPPPKPVTQPSSFLQQGENIFHGAVGAIGSTLHDIGQKAIDIAPKIPEAHFADKMNFYTPLGFVANLAQGIINTPAEALKGNASIVQHIKKGDSTPQQVAGDVAAAVQLPLMLLTGGESSVVKEGLVGAAKQLVEGGVKGALKGIAKEGVTGAGFGVLGGLQSGKNITTVNDYVKNLLQNIGIGAATGAGIGTVTHLAVPLAKGLSNKAGAILIKNADKTPTIQEVHVDPKIAQSVVLGNNLEKTPAGKAILKESVIAEQAGGHVAIIPAKDGKYTVGNGEKINVETVPVYQPGKEKGAGETTVPSLSKLNNEASLPVAGRKSPSGDTTSTSFLDKSTKKSLPSNRTNFLKSFDITTPSQEQYNKYYESMQAVHSDFNKTGKEIAKETDGEFISRIKSQESLDKKLVRKNQTGTRPLGDMNDTLAGTVLTDNIDKSVKTAEGKGVKITTDYREKPTFLGYKGVHADYELPNGAVSEVQFNTKEGLAQKIYAHEIYDKWRSAIENNGSTTIGDTLKLIPQDKYDEFLADIQKSKDIYDGKEIVPTKYYDRVQKLIDESNQQTVKKEVKPQEKQLQSSSQTPVGTGKSRESEAFSKFVDHLQESDPKRYEELKDGKVTYNRLNLEKDARAAMELVQKDPTKAYNIAKGIESPPAGQTETAISIALADRATKEGDYAKQAELETARSLRQTRRGQEIVSERGRFNDTSPYHYIQQVLDTRMKKLGSSIINQIKEKLPGEKLSIKKAAVERIDIEVKKVKEILTKEQRKIRVAQDILDSLTCK